MWLTHQIRQSAPCDDGCQCLPGPYRGHARSRPCAPPLRCRSRSAARSITSRRSTTVRHEQRLDPPPQAASAVVQNELAGHSNLERAPPILVLHHSRTMSEPRWADLPSAAAGSAGGDSGLSISLRRRKKFARAANTRKICRPGVPQTPFRPGGAWDSGERGCEKRTSKSRIEIAGHHPAAVLGRRDERRQATITGTEPFLLPPTPGGPFVHRSAPGGMRSPVILSLHPHLAAVGAGRSLNASDNGPSVMGSPWSSPTSDRGTLPSMRSPIS